MEHMLSLDTSMMKGTQDETVVSALTSLVSTSQSVPISIL